MSDWEMTDLLREIATSLRQIDSNIRQIKQLLEDQR